MDTNGALISVVSEQLKSVRDAIKRRKAEISTLKGKVSRLKEAKKKVGKYKSEVKELQTRASKRKIAKKCDVDWKGDKYGEYTELVDAELKTSFDNYIDAIDTCLDAIVDKQTEYENRIKEKTDLISGLTTKLNNLSASWEKMLN